MTPPADASDLLCEELDRVDSTNDYLRPYVGEGHWRRVVAREQTRGRGRYGRHWHSAPGEGLYVSFLIYPEMSLTDATLLHQISSLAVVAALQTAGPSLRPRLKRPNDVLIGGRKIAGILIELGTTDRRLNWCIIGIGVNLFQESFPDLPGDTATSLRLEKVEVDDRGKFCDSLTRELLARIAQAAAGDSNSLHAQYRRLLA